MIKYHWIIILLLQFNFARGQNIDSAVSSAVKVLHQQRVDSIVTVGLSLMFHGMEDTLAGIGPVTPFEIRYLIYRKNRTVCSRKFVEYLDTKGEKPIVAVSRLIEINCDSLYVWMGLNLNELRNEDIYPYISKQLINGKEVYTPLIIDHVVRFDFWFHIHDKWFGKTVNPDDLERVSFMQSENLNYAYNSHTKLSEFFGLVTGYIDKFDHKYVF